MDLFIQGNTAQGKTVLTLTLTNNKIPQCPYTDYQEQQNIFTDTTSQAQRT